MASFGGDDNNEGDVNIPAPTSVVTFGQVIVRVMGFERPLLGLRDTSCVQINQDIALYDQDAFDTVVIDVGLRPILRWLMQHRLFDEPLAGPACIDPAFDAPTSWTVLLAG